MQKITLRKKAVYNKIMMHRKMYEEKRRCNFINIKNLDLSKYKDEIEQLISLETLENKILYMTKYLENNIKPVDIFSNLYFSNENIELNDLAKYYLINILAILDKKVMNEIFPDTNKKNNILIITKEHPLIMSKKLFEIFFSILCKIKMMEVQYTVLELLLNYSYGSYNFVAHCIEDKKYIKILFKLTYINNNEIINNSIIILDNILSSEICSNKDLAEIIQDSPIIERCKEFLTNNKINNDVKINSLLLLYSMSEKIEHKYYSDYFIDFIPVFYNLRSLNKKNEEIFWWIIQICEKITDDDNICISIKDSGLGNIFFHYLETSYFERKFVVEILKIFTNLFNVDEIIIYFMQYTTVIDVFIKIINNYMNTSNEKDNKLLFRLIYCLSNLATGPPDTQYTISRSKIPKLIIEIMKEKPCNDIYFEGIHFFYNILSECNKETFQLISVLHPFEIFAKGLEMTNLVDHIEIILKAIIYLMNKNKAIYYTIENLKKEFYACLIQKRLENLTLHKNEQISSLAEEALRIIEDKMNTE